MLEDKILFRESKYITKGENNKYLDTSLYEDTTRLSRWFRLWEGRRERKKIHISSSYVSHSK